MIRTAEARIYTDIEPDVLAAYARDDAHLQLLREVQATAVIIVPLAAPTRTLGAITLVSSESSRRLTQADLGLAVRLGRRAGTAVENARLYTERVRIAHTLQRSLLPESLPEIAGVEIQTLYAAAGELNEVGGDFYDVFDYDEDRTMLVIGDVCGKGPRAAGVTALARHTLRAAAIGGQSPAEMLATLHQALLRQPPGADLCTVCLIMLAREQHGARLTIALAGHPPPLLIRGDGDVEQVGRSGTVLGVIDPVSIEESEIALAPRRRCCCTPMESSRRADPATCSASTGCSSSARRRQASRWRVPRAHRACGPHSRRGPPPRRHRAAGAPLNRLITPGT